MLFIYGLCKFVTIKLLAMKRFLKVMILIAAVMCGCSCDGTDVDIEGDVENNVENNVEEEVEEEVEEGGDSDSVISVSSVSLDKTELSLTVGESYSFVASLSPADATNKNVSWTSSATSVASVDASGLVTAVAAGTAVITVTTEDGGKTATCDVMVEDALLADVESITDLKYGVNTPADEFYVTWTGVENASGYKCWYVTADDTYETPSEAIDNGDGTWTARSSTDMGANTYTFYVIPIPAEGHALKSETPASVEIVLPELKKTGFSYRFMSDSVEEGVEYEAACYDLVIKYKNIQFLKSDKTKPIADDWYIYTTTPVDDIHHLEMWYSLYYDDEDENIKVYSSTTPGVKQTQLVPDGDIKSGKWKVYYSVPEGHKYIYIEGCSKSVYLLWTAFYLCHTPVEE